MKKDLKMNNLASKIRSCRNTSAAFRYSIGANVTTANPSRLLVRSKPKPDESFMGYLVRLSEENGYDMPSWILHLAGLNYQQAYNRTLLFKSTPDLRRLASLTDNKLDRLAALTYPSANVVGVNDVILFYGAQLHKYLIRSHTPRVCPDCLQLFGYCRRVWDLALVTVCPLHRRLLLDKCPKCKSHISNSRSSVSVCLCGYDYRTAEPRLVPKDEIALTRQIYFLCHLNDYEDSKPQPKSPIQNLDLSSLAKLVVFLTGQNQGVMTTTGKKYINCDTNDGCHKSFTKAYSIFDKWPQSYYEFLEQLQLQDEYHRATDWRYGSGLGKRFGAFYYGLCTRLQSSKFDFMRTAFSAFAATRWQSEYSPKVGWPKSSRIRATYLILREVRRRLQVGSEYLEHLIETGMLKVIARQIGKKRIFLIEAESVTQIKLTHENAILIEEAARKLNVSVETVDKLIAKGCLIALSRPKARGFTGWRISDTKIEELLQTIRNKIAKPARADASDWLDFKSAYRRLQTYYLTIAFFVESILKNKIVPCGEDVTKVGLSRFMFRSADIDAFLKSFSKPRRVRRHRKTNLYERGF